MTNPTFHVSAESQLEVAPEFGLVHVHVSSVTESKQESYRLVVEAHNRLIEGLNTNSAVVDDKATAPRSYSFNEWNGKKPTLKYRTDSSIKVRFVDLAALGEFVAALSNEILVSSTVSWGISEQARKGHERELRREAVSRARSIAEDYAVGDNLKPESLRLSSMTDRPARNDYFGAAPRGAMAKVGAFDGAPPVAVVEPEDILIYSSIEAVFIAELG